MQIAHHILLWIALVGQAAVAVDKTREPRTFGKDVVFSVTQYLKVNSIFTFDYGFIRRLAYVETMDGVQAKTYNGTNGGIWQVKELWFQATQSSNNQNALASIKSKIQSMAGIDWSTVQYTDLDKPLYSALAVGLYFSIFNQWKTTVSTQATYWNQYYHGGLEDNNYFTTQVTELESTKYCAARSLVYFVIDGSGSVGASNFQSSLNFVNLIVEGLDMGDKKARVGMLHYSNRPTAYFDFNGDKAAVKNAISNTPYTRGGTATGAAIDTALGIFQGTSAESGVSRVMVVLTDGRSGDSVVEPAARAKAAGITTIAVGIGQGIRESELLQIANAVQPNVLQSSSFTAIDNIIALLQNSVCLVPAPVNLEEDTEIELRPDETTWVETPAQAPGICVTVRTTSGVVAGYVSFTTQHPNSAVYETMLGINANTYVTTDQSSATKLYIAFQTQSESATVILNLNPLCPTFTTTTTTTTHPFKAIKRFYTDGNCRESTGWVEQTIDNVTGCITERRFKDGAWDNNTYYSRYHCAEGKRYLITYTKNTGCFYDPFTADGLQYIQWCLTNFLATRCDVAMEVTDDWDKRRSGQCFDSNDPRGLEGWGPNAKSEQYDDPLPPALACGESSMDYFFTTTTRRGSLMTDHAPTNAVRTVYVGLILIMSFIMH